MNRRSFLLRAGASASSFHTLRFAQAAEWALDPARNVVLAHRTPAWFRDAKFGITAQWTPQSVPEDGDWYARNMYVQGSEQYQHHLEHFGHPSRVGYKELCRRWNGSAFNPAELTRLYRRAGAAYLVILANHHDGFDCWNSAHQPWNSVRLGPRRDIVGEWRACAEREGLRFGVEFFCTQNWDWFQPSHGADATGPLAGVPYDGNLTAAQGSGQWWHGLDPQQLYGRPHPKGVQPDAAYLANFEARVLDLFRQHRPDLIFYTDNGLPLGELGYRVTARQIRDNIRTHGGSDEAVVCTKRVPAELRASVVWDRFPDDALASEPWQMDICIGNWHYKHGLKYKTLADILPYLVDVVSKNGNLLLNFPIRADGTLDAEERAILERLAAWMDIHREGIFGTRPWHTFGEGPTRTQPVDFPDRTLRYTSQDIRFTTRQDLVYAWFLSPPRDGKLAIGSLGRNAATPPGRIRSVTILGSADKPAWNQTETALLVTMPAPREIAYPGALRVSFG